MKIRDEKINNLYLALKQEAQNAPEVEEGSLYDNYRSFYLPDFFKRRAMELEIAMRTKLGRASRISALCKTWENQAIKLFQKVDEQDDPDNPQSLLLQEMGEIYCKRAGELRLSNQPETVFEFMFNIFLKYAKRPGARRF